MSEKQTILTLKLDGQDVKLHLVRSTTRTGIRRSLMIYSALDENEKAIKDGVPVDKEEFTVKRRIYPDCICGTESAEGMDFPLTLAQLMDLPEEFVDDWASAIYKLNPHWNAVAKPTEEATKKKEKS
jgi:hypothetical protein